MTTRAAFVAILGTCLLAGATSHADQAAGVSEQMRLGMTLSVVENVNAADARASAVLWAEGIASAVGLYRSVDGAVFSTVDEAVRAVNEGRTEILVLSSPEYLEVEKRFACRPSMAYEIMGEVTQEFVLVAKRGRAPVVPASSSIAIYVQNPKAALAQMWGDTYFHDAGFPRGLASFASVRTIERKGRPTMSVFFGQADYAIDTRSAFASTVELNPQVGRDLEVLAHSESLLPGLVCISDRMSPELRRRYIDAAARMHDEVRYRQSMIVMRVSRIVPWDPRFLDTTRALLARHAALTARAVK
jgi:ABC-type phosphate/phosphonate transport system substrate-binding protein